MVHQELNLVLQRTVMDNMWLGRYPTKGLFVDHGKMYQDTKHIFEELDIDIDPRVKVGTLSVSQMQMIEIAKAFSYDAKIVIMDEPTSSLTEKEVNHLFKIINKLKEKGCGIVYISHKMEEIFQLCDEITILRDGQWVATQPLQGMTMDPVSYTHLKGVAAVAVEQGLHLLMGNGFHRAQQEREAIELLIGKRCEALVVVSYTHLDVYKRQHWNRPMPKACL